MQLEAFQRQENKVLEIKTTENYTSHKLMCIRLYFQINEQQKKRQTTWSLKVLYKYFWNDK